MPEFRRGIGAIEEATKPSGVSGKFRSFVPSVLWTKSEPEKFVLVLTPIDEVVTALIHTWIPVEEYKKGGQTKLRNEDFLSRKDPSISESTDTLQDELDRDPISRTIGVAVELEPVFEVVRGRERPVSFTVATRTFTRHTDDGDEEEVETPRLGLIIQSPTFWKQLASLDNQQGPLEILPVKIVRDGFDKTTTYTSIPFPDAPVDLSGIIEHLEGLTYLTSELPEIIAEIDSVEDDESGLSAAQVVARTLMDTRLNELADPERYNELVDNIRYLPPPFSNGKPKFGAIQAAAEEKPTRRSQRDSSPVEEEVPETKAKAKPKPKAKVEPEEEEEAAPKKESQKSRFEELKARVEASKAS